MAPAPRRTRGTIDRLPSGAYQVRVYAGTDPVTGKRHDLVEVIPAGPRTVAEAEKVRTRLLRQRYTYWARYRLMSPGGVLENLHHPDPLKQVGRQAVGRSHLSQCRSRPREMSGVNRGRNQPLLDHKDPKGQSR